MNEILLNLQIPLEHLVQTGLSPGTILGTPFLYTAKDKSMLGNSNPPFRALLFYSRKSFLDSGWDIEEISKDMGKRFSDFNLDMDNVNYYNGIYTIGNLAPLSDDEEHEFKEKVKKVKEWHSNPLIRYSITLDNYLRRP